MDIENSNIEYDVYQDFTDLFSDRDSRERLDNILLKDANVQNKGPEYDFTYSSDEYQNNFIESESDTIRLLAPAGSGKTQSIINRILKLSSKGENPSSFLVLTFDKAASISLKEKLNEALKENNITINEQPNISTLNAFGYYILRNQLKRGNENLTVCSNRDMHECFRKAKTLILENEKFRQIENILFPSNIKQRVFIEIISSFKNYIIDPENIDKKLCLEMFENTDVLKPWSNYFNTIDNIHMKIASGIVALYSTYCKIQKNLHHIDFDDQKLISYLRLKEQPGIAIMIMSKYKEIIVDEFQDINRLDFELIKLLTHDKKLIIVGDDDQAIYGFRGCSPKYIINFENESGRKTSSFILQKNYRCPKNVVEKSMKLIRHNKNREDKEIYAHSKEDADISVWNSINCGGEAQIISRMIKKIIRERENFDLNKISVLYRMNSQSLPIQIALILEDIPYYCRKEDNILLSDIMLKVIKLIELYLKLKENPHFYSNDHTQNLFKCYFRFVNDSELRSLNNRVENNSGYFNLTSTLNGLNNKFSVTGFRDSINVMFKDHNSAESLLKDIGTKFKNIGGMIGSLEEAYNNFLPLGEFIDIASRFKGSIQEFYDLLKNLVVKVQNGLYHDSEGEAVSLLSYFKAKGRQWDTVFLPGVNQSVIPHQKAKIEEERRLFYVAITRATSNLFISYVRKAVGQNVNISQFILEMDMDSGTEKRSTMI